jgi:cell division protein FtsN
LRNNYGLSLALSGDYPAAVATLNPIAADPGAPSRYRLNLALVYGLAGDDKKAAAITRSSLDEAAIRNNLAYYALLRAMDDKQRAAAIVGAQLHGTPVPDAEQTAAAAPVEPPKPAPVVEVQTAPLSPPVTATAAPPAEPAPVAKPAPRPAASRVAKAAPMPAPAAPPAKEETPASTPSEAPHDAAAEHSDVAAPTKLARPSEPVTEAKQQAPEPPKATPPAAAEAAPAPASAEATPVAAAKPEKPVRSAASSAGFAVQLGSFSSEANARKLAEQLNGKGYAVTVSHDRDHDGRDWFTVRAGSYGSSDEAAAVAQRLREGENIPAVVVRHRGAAQAQAASGHQG